MYCIDCGEKMVVTDKTSKITFYFCSKCSGWASVYNEKVSKHKDIEWVSNTKYKLSDFINSEKYYLNT